MTVDLSSGTLGSIAQAVVVVGPTVDTPWDDALALRECEIAVDGSGKDPKIVLVLPESIGRAGRYRSKKSSAPSHLGEGPNHLLAELNPTLFVGAASEMISPPSVSLRYRNGRDSQIHYLLLAMRAEVDEGCPGGRMFGESLATTLAVHLMRRYAVFPGKLELNRQGLPERRLRAVVDYIEAHLSEDVTLGQLANLAHMSQFHLGHLFKQSTGLSPHQYLLRRRIAKAKTLLATGKLALAEISCMLGFASQTHFTTVFRKFAGITPLAYRNKL